MTRPRLFWPHLVLTALVLESGAVLAQCPAGNWATLSPMNEPRQELAAAELDGKIYAVGGLGGRPDANEIYDLVTDRWSLGADLPAGTDHAWAVSLGGRLYVGGGTSNRVFSYDPSSDTWTEVASSTFVHGGTPAAAVIDGRIFVAGGAGGGMAGNELESYDPAADHWTTLAPMACARNHTAGGLIGGKLYVAGGRPGNQVCVEAYDPASNTWTPRASMPTGRSGIAGAVVGGCLYVFGGEGNAADPNGIFHEVEAYDPANDEWFRLPPMQTGRHGIYAAVLGDVVYLPGGSTVQGLGTTGVNEAYEIDRSDATARQPVVLSVPRPRTTPRPVPRD
jgi:N-acetylneuraminic acid mutarotase